MILKPRPPVYEQDNAPSSNDRAKGGFSLRALERILASGSGFDDWNAQTEIAHAYYDGDNITPEMARRARDYGFDDVRNKNLVARVVNTVLGQEEKSRRDPKFDADDDSFADVAEVHNMKLKEAQRETNADMEIGTSYASQVKGGLGWCGVSKRADPFCYPYVVEDIPWQEMKWDKRAKKIDYSDAAWICREQFKDLGSVLAAYPEHEEVLRQSTQGVAAWADDSPIDEDVIQTNGFGANNARSWFGTRRTHWVDSTNDRVRMYEIEYKVQAMAVVMKVGRRTIMVDKTNPVHQEAIARGIQLKTVPTQQIRRAIFAGPVRLSDEATTQKRYSKIPFVAFRRDIDRLPYGLIFGMIGPQDDYNESSMRMRWMLQAQQLTLDADALAEKYNTIEDVTATMMRPDMVAVLNQNRVNKGSGLKFENNFQLKQELFGRMNDSEKLVQGVPGIFNASMGNGQPGTSSGIAISSLVEQGMVSMGELNGNYAYSRRLVYETLMDTIADDLTERDMEVMVGSGASRRPVILNTRNPATGAPMNMVKEAPVKLGLGEVPSSAAYQIQQSQQIGEMIRALAGTPQAAVLIPSWVEQTSAFGPNRKAMAEDMRKIGGLPPAGDKEGADMMQQQAQQQQAQLAQQQAALMEADLLIKQANARKATAEAMLAEQQLQSGAALEQSMATVLKTKGDAFAAIKRARSDNGELGMPEQANEDEMIAQALAEAQA